MIWTTKTNCALSSRKRIDSAIITTTRLSTHRMGSRKVITAMPPATAIAAATKKTTIATLSVRCPPPLGGRVGERGVSLGQPRLHLRRQRLQQLLLGVDELLAAGVRQLVLRSEHYRLHGARLLAVTAEDAAEHVDLVRLGVPLARRDTLLVGVLRGDDEDASDRAGGRAQLAADAALQPVVVAAQVMTTAIALGAGTLLLRVLGGDHRSEELLERGLQPARESGHIGGNTGFRPFRLRRHALTRTPQRRRVARTVLVFVRHRYPCTTTRTTPVTMMLAIDNGNSTFPPSRIAIS